MSAIKYVLYVVFSSTELMLLHLYFSVNKFSIETLNVQNIKTENLPSRLCIILL